jgi:hypothetical protein
MGRENYARAVFSCVADCRKRRPNARVVVDTAVFNGHIEINSNEDAFAREVEIFN